MMAALLAGTVPAFVVCALAYLSLRHPRVVAGVVVVIVAGVGAVLTAAPADASGSRVFRPCASEDSAGPCVWDARHAGNGVGSSFIRRRDGRLVVVSHARAHRLLFGCCESSGGAA